MKGLFGLFGLFRVTRKKPPLIGRWIRAASLSSVLLATVVGFPRVASAASDADTFFNEGIRLLDAGKISEACTSFEKSQALEPAAGTLLNLAGCYEKAHRNALALRTFRSAEVSAKARGRDDWEKTARDHARALELTVPILTFRLPPSSSAVSTDVITDEQVVPPSELASYPVDPGVHVVEARGADGKIFFSRRYAVRASMEIVIGVPPPTRSEQKDTPTSTTSSSLSRRKILGLIVGGVGVGVTSFGIVAAIVANGELKTAQEHCPSYPDVCTSGASDPNDSAKSWSTISTIGVVGGLALVATGAALFLWPSPSGVAMRRSSPSSTAVVFRF